MKIAQIELYREMVPMAEATAVAYHVIHEKGASLKDPRYLDDVRGLVAIALASVATVLTEENGTWVPMSSAAINERLFVRGSRPDLQGLYMRRLDLLHAIEVLKEAHVAFDRTHVLDSIRKLS